MLVEELDFCVYMPPPNENLNVALDALTGIMDTSRNGGVRLDIVLLGDINVDFLSSSSNSKAVKQFSYKCGLSQLLLLLGQVFTVRRYLTISTSMLCILLSGAPLMPG